MIIFMNLENSKWSIIWNGESIFSVANKCGRFVLRNDVAFDKNESIFVLQVLLTDVGFSSELNCSDMKLMNT
jgi:hypothetical protein